VNFKRNLAGAREPLRLDLTSLVDVVFLLIIFLLVSTTFKKTEHAFEIRLPVAGTESVVVRTDAALLFITDTGELAFLDPTKTGEGINPASDEVIRGQIKEYLESHPDAPIRVRAGKAVEYQKVLGAVSLVHGVGAGNVQLEYDKKNPSEQPASND